MGLTGQRRELGRAGAPPPTLGEGRPSDGSRRPAAQRPRARTGPRSQGPGQRPSRCWGRGRTPCHLLCPGPRRCLLPAVLGRTLRGPRTRALCGRPHPAAGTGAVTSSPAPGSPRPGRTPLAPRSSDPGRTVCRAARSLTHSFISSRGTEDGHRATVPVPVPVPGRGLGLLGKRWFQSGPGLAFPAPTHSPDSL